MSIDVSVVISAHNPRLDYLARTLEALRAQTLEQDRWELLLIDNASDQAVSERHDLTWHLHGTHLHESSGRLVLARLAGMSKAQADLIVFVDDDNILAPDYLAKALAISAQYPSLGTWGGRVIPEFEAPGAAPPTKLFHLLALRDVHQDVWSNDPSHHASTPWGTGLCVRRSVAEGYRRELEENPARAALDPQGQTLLYGGDTDISYAGCRMGLGKGLFSALALTHLIPARRCTLEHLTRVAHGKGYSEVLHEYASSGSVRKESRSTLRHFLWRFRLLRQTPLERAVAMSHLRGVSKAMKDLGAGI
jgi:glycosyltransferase involved in cell wall biosynthesis